MKKVQIALVIGDGSAPEMMEPATRIAIAAAKLDDIEIEFIPTPMGWNAYEKFGDTLPEKSLEKATELGLLFFGGVGDLAIDATLGKEHPEMMPEARALLTIRNRWDLLVNFRPVIFYPQLAGIAKVKVNPETMPPGGIKQVWLRFFLEDSYFGNYDLSSQIRATTRIRLGIMDKSEVVASCDEIVTDLAYYTKEAVERYARYGFSLARQMKLSVICVDKANVMARYVFWRKIVTKIQQQEFPDVPMKCLYVDAVNSLLFSPEQLHGVILCGNEHGDILSDGAAASVGSMGLMCSSAINPETRAAMFESGAGTAPTLAGKNIANPIGRILTAALMLRHIGAEKGAVAIESAVRLVLEEGWRTQDIASGQIHYDPGQKIVGTSEMGKLILEGL